MCMPTSYPKLFVGSSNKNIRQIRLHERNKSSSIGQRNRILHPAYQQYMQGFDHIVKRLSHLSLKTRWSCFAVAFSQPPKITHKVLESYEVVAVKSSHLCDPLRAKEQSVQGNPRSSCNFAFSNVMTLRRIRQPPATIRMPRTLLRHVQMFIQGNFYMQAVVPWVGHVTFYKAHNLENIKRSNQFKASSSDDAAKFTQAAMPMS